MSSSSTTANSTSATQLEYQEEEKVRMYRDSLDEIIFEELDVSKLAPDLRDQISNKFKQQSQVKDQKQEYIIDFPYWYTEKKLMERFIPYIDGIWRLFLACFVLLLFGGVIVGPFVYVFWHVCP